MRRTLTRLAQPVVSWLARPATLRQAALASLVANLALVVTGGAVRLTGSGLGCPTWPRCTDSSYVTTAAMGLHGAIEYGNRMLAGVLTAIAVAGVAAALAQRPRRRRVTGLSAGLLASIPAQAVLGGITVLTGLNPWVVACHFLLSIAIITLAYMFWTATAESDEAPVATVPPAVRALTQLLAAVAGATIVVGTVVTGSGPHAGDEHARRTGLDPAALAQAHADIVFLLAGMAVATWLVVRAVAASDPTARPVAVRAAWLVGIVLGQGVVGFVQYFTGLPAVVVGVHLAGACAVWLAVLSLRRATRPRPLVGRSELTRQDHPELAAVGGPGR